MNVPVLTEGRPEAAPSSLNSSAYLELKLQGDGSWLIVDPVLRHAALACDLFALRLAGRADVPQINPVASRMSVRVLRSTMRTSLLCGSSIKGPAARLLSDHVSALEGYRQHGGTTECAQLQRETCALITECVRSLQHPSASTDWRPSRRFWWHRVWWHIENHLTDPELSPARLSSDLGISRSALYRHFAPPGGLCRYIKSRRLEVVISSLSRSQVQSPEFSARKYGFRSSTQLLKILAAKQ